jgi:hypothetical protein
MARTKNGYFIQQAIHKPNTFHNWCVRQGHKGATGACIQQGLRSRDIITRRRANLARTLARIRPYH